MQLMRCAKIYTAINIRLKHTQLKNIFSAANTCCSLYSEFYSNYSENSNLAHRELINGPKFFQLQRTRFFQQKLSQNLNDESEYSGGMIASHRKTAVVDFCNGISQLRQRPPARKYIYHYLFHLTYSASPSLHRSKLLWSSGKDTRIAKQQLLFSHEFETGTDTVFTVYTYLLHITCRHNNNNNNIT